MPSLTIRNLEPETKDALRRRAVARGTSMQDEAREILGSALGRRTVDTSDDSRSLYQQIRAIVEPIGGIEIDLPPRELAPDPPSFD